ncbi:MAG: hypothetical protein IJV35_06805 [Neisseriaceae bacterium]|nr:hypothetical protein [Neisseriaceae bacterium]
MRENAKQSPKIGIADFRVAYPKNDNAKNRSGSLKNQKQGKHNELR